MGISTNDVDSDILYRRVDNFGARFLPEIANWSVKILKNYKGMIDNDSVPVYFVIHPGPLKRLSP